MVLGEGGCVLRPSFTAETIDAETSGNLTLAPPPRCRYSVYGIPHTLPTLIVSHDMSSVRAISSIWCDCQGEGSLVFCLIESLTVSLTRRVKLLCFVCYYKSDKAVGIKDFSLSFHFGVCDILKGI